MNNCMHIIDVKETGTKIVTYCTLCGTIFNVKEAQEYNIRDTNLSSGTYINKPYTQTISGVDLANPPYMVKKHKGVKKMSNKYQEALDYLASLWEIEGEITVKSDTFDRFNRVETLIEDKVRRADRENVKILQELVDKETPMKVTHQATIYSCCTCPNCLNAIDEFEDFRGQKVRVTFDYCRFCGQHLDWSEE